MEDLLRELEEAACEWPENHRLAQACRCNRLPDFPDPIGFDVEYR